MRAFDKKAIARQIERERRAGYARRLRVLLGNIRRYRSERRELIGTIRGQCKAARVKLRQNCARRQSEARETGEKRIGAAQRELAQERSDEALTLRAIHGDRKRGGRRTAAERRQEEDELTRNDIPAELVPIFDRLKKHFKATAHQSRAEAFLHWAHDNSDEVSRLLFEEQEAEALRMIAEHQHLEREAFARRRRASGDVPF